jgi:hypothetical protein
MFYTYLWLREDGTPYYVGKGTGDRGFTNDQHRVRYPGKSYTIVQEFESESDAFEAEIFLISYYGRKDLGSGCLRNLTNGGDGCSGRIGNFIEGRPVSLETRKKIADGNRGKVRNTVTVQQMSVGMKKKWAESDYKPVPPSWKGKKRGPMSADHRLKLSLAHKRRLEREK